MNEDDFYSAGMNEFQKIIQEYQEKFEQSRIEAAMMDGAEQLARDVRALPKPRSQIRKSGYTHLLDTVSARKGKNGKILWPDGRGRNTENECTAASARIVQKRFK